MGVSGRRLVIRPGGGVEVEDFELPAPGPRQLLVRVARSQVSAGSEMNGYRRLAALPASGGGAGRGHTTGYTAVGRVLEVADDVTSFRVGDRVLAGGNHASHCLVDLSDPEDWRAYPDLVPDGVTDEQACYAVLGDVALHGVRRAGLQIDESVAVFGAGVVGQLTMQLARLSGAHPIVAVDLYAARLELARRLGATHAVDASQHDAAAAVREVTGGGAETVFHCSGVAQVLQAALSAAAPRGTVVLTASAPGAAEIQLQPELLRRELTVLGSYETGLMQPHPYWPWTRQRNRAACYRLMGAGELVVDALTSHVLSPDRADGAYRMMAAGGAGWMSVFFAWD